MKLSKIYERAAYENTPETFDLMWIQQENSSFFQQDGIQPFLR